MKRLNNNILLLLVKIFAIVLAAIVLGVLMQQYGDNKNALAWTLPSLIAIGLLYAVMIRHLQAEDETGSYYVNKYHDVFFKGTIVFAILLVLLSIIYSALMYLDDRSTFSIVGLLLMITWIAVFMIYFVWSVYHYNINFGITDGEWKKIAESKRDSSEFGFDVPSNEVREPLYNPYRSQTFGLPPGTVRGMIAFTLLIGGVSLFISSMGNQEISPELAALRIQQFEFFETAFLMMIAFYFGDRSLRYFRERWKNPNSTDQTGTSSGHSTDLSPSVQPTAIDDEVTLDDREFLDEDQEFETGIPDEKPDSGLTSLKNTLLHSRGGQITAQNNFAFVQILDNINSKILNDKEIKEALEDLADQKGIILSLPVIKAVITVESSGRGHLSNGKAKILFEGHKFWYWLKQAGKTDAELKALQQTQGNILYEKWTREYYKGGNGEYERLEKAKAIDEKAAIYSASWGLFQILGENLSHNIKSRDYEDVREFEEKQHAHERFHFLDFLAFIQTKKLSGKTPLIDFISENNNPNGSYNWANFAYGYNGSGYAVNKYDIKLKAAYEKFK